MSIQELIRIRLINQQIAVPIFNRPEQVVNHLVAMQAQEYAQARWAIGLRSSGLTDSVLERAFDDGAILRTHLMRPTWHFVTPADIRWLLSLTSPRVHQTNSFMYRKEGLDKKTLSKSIDVLSRALEGGNSLTRTELNESLKKSRIKANGLRLGYIMMNAELEQIICSGPRHGKQFTYALLDERVKLKKKSYHREQALAEFSRRYFTTRGPAAITDFATWSGLTMAEAKAGAGTLSKEFEKRSFNGKEYLFKSPSQKWSSKFCSTFLMPDYDEFGMSYKDRSAYDQAKRMTSHAGALFRSHILIVDGVFGGTWRRPEKGGEVSIKTFPPFKESDSRIKEAVKRYRLFIG